MLHYEANERYPAWRGDHWEFSSVYARVIAVIDTWFGQDICLLVLHDHGVDGNCVAGFFFDELDHKLLEAGAGI